ncbi:MAG: SDR family NAD(P)-dependent oxidoreductase [Thermoplasmata archaeon]|nr:SDR family NAD(P)-dependent oxidoreductase [Thermoplasmata archaeon]
MGLELARTLAQHGARLLIVGRDERRTSAAVDLIRTASGSRAIESVVVEDLALISGVRRAAASIGKTANSVHLLVNNAGALFAQRRETREGLERTFALNVLAPYLLTTLLAPSLVAGTPSRVVNVSSAAHRHQRVPWEDLGGARRYGGYTAYGRSKLELLLLTHEFSRRFAGTGVTVNAFHPGFVRTGFGQNNTGLTRVMFRALTRGFGISPARGARTGVYLATAPEVAQVSGEYFVRSRARRSSSASYDPAGERRLFDRCAELTGTAFPALSPHAV